MTPETIYLLLLGIAGIAIDILTKLKEWITSPVKPNKYVVIINFLISVIVTVALIHARKDIEPIFVITPVGALILGFMAHTIFRKVASIKSNSMPDEIK